MACCWSFWGRRRLRARDVELTRVGPLGRGGPGVDLPSSASPSSLSCITCLLCRLVLLGLFVGQQHRAGWTRSGETRRSSREARGRGELAEPQDGSRLCRGQGAGSQHHIRRKQIRSTFKPRRKFFSTRYDRARNPGKAGDAVRRRETGIAVGVPYCYWETTYALSRHKFHSFQ